MEDWFKDVGRPALFEALAGVCDRIDNDYKSDVQSLSQDKARLAAELETLKQKAFQVDRLEEENQSLKSELEIAKKSCRNELLPKGQVKPTVDDRGVRTPLAPRSANPVSTSKRSTKLDRVDIDAVNLSELRAEYLKVESSYAKLYDKYRELQDIHKESNALLRKRTTAYHKWVDHATKLDKQSQSRNRRIQRLEAKLVESAQGPLNSSFSSDTGDAQPGTRRAAHTPGPAHVEEPDELGRARLDPVSRNSPILWPPENLDEADFNSANPDHNSGARANRDTEKSQNGSSTPEPDDDDNGEQGLAPFLPPLPQCHGATAEKQLGKNEPSSDTPVVVSERWVGKRKHGHDESEHTRAPTRLKAEHAPETLSTVERRRFEPQESMDFDVEARRVQTPKKHHRVLRIHEDKPIGSIDISGIQEGSPDSTDRRDRAAATPTNLNERNAALPGGKPPGTHAIEQAATSELHPEGPSVLRPLDPNIVAQRDLGTQTKAQHQKRSLLHGIDSLAEDGGHDDMPRKSTSKKKQKNRVLHELLNSPSPEHERGALPSSVQDKEIPTSNAIQFRMPQKRELPFGKDGRKRVSGALQAPASPTVSTYNATTAINPKGSVEGAASKGDSGKDVTPLRECPKSRLRLGDFKINPNPNEGLDYAFTEVVRSKEERAQLQGCVKANCCGPARRAEARVMRETTGPFGFQSLLESYLGDECHILSSMSDSEKEELWIEAKARELANAHGRHRERFPRPVSPDGYWRMDFPSTQEAEQHNKEGAKMERQMINDRYREAMRPGGRWKFRDE
ncbi:Uu.00g099880.m01.CDS01 [Anthostomella pinea]|uniref:Uu.00g099880.m01.CDS01 n=1 Tax=Anthostomella pinea TaxID=933095 RepID=A0AAI8VCW3_9PEZI|nr:Uu.00g099880.m01.CDS01 [Anthostomella pinea]